MTKSDEYLNNLIQEGKRLDARMWHLESIAFKQGFSPLVGKGFWEYHLSNLKKLIEEERKNGNGKSN